ncbi:MAG: N-acetyl-gamma-glutamyl-phosphate reductase [Clostridia bacterium]|nr:N-acetyl-gamma-glutamyl-phosphate reductase [Clostridia bacterium]
MKNVFIDGGAGTTGLKIMGRLRERKDLNLLSLPEELRKDTDARREAFEKADIVFLCLPDDAAREAVGLTGSSHAVVIDTSTAHRTADGWTYGLPELKGQKEKIRSSRWIANPGCHATGFIALVAPLVAEGLLKEDALLSCFSLTGYSGGGKKMIAEYESPQRDALLDAPRQYGIKQAHKHLPEMQKYCGLENAPIFCPVVASYFAGMEVTVPLFASQLRGTAQDIRSVYECCYAGKVIRYKEDADENGFLSAGAYSGLDSMEISVHGGKDRLLLVARFDNLGKGASGAAIQNMNLVLGLPEETGLVI